MTQDTTTTTSGAADLPEALIHAGMQALLQCTASELENLSPTLFEGYAGDVQRVFAAMTGKALSAALAAGQATAAPAQPAAEPSRFGSPELQAMIIARCVEKDQADRVQEDAARYRFLRDGEWRDTDLEPFIRLQLNTLWDAKIDAARAAQEGTKT